MNQPHARQLPYDEAHEGRAIIAQMASQPLLGKRRERILAEDLWKLRSLIKAVSESASEVHDSTMAAEYTRQLLLLQDEFTEKRDLFFSSNIRLVLDIIAPMSRMEYMDMFQLGCLGLMRAIDKYDPSYQVNGNAVGFSTYATRWIKQAVQRGCDNEESLITLPVHIRDLLKSIRRYIVRYTQDKGEPPTLDVICDTMNLSYKKIVHIKSISSIPYSLNKVPLREGQTTSLVEYISDPDHDPLDIVVMEEARQEVVAFIHACLDRLAAYELGGTCPYTLHADVIRARYRIGEPLDPAMSPQRSLKEVGQLFDLDPDQVRQLQRVGVRWIVKEYQDALESLRS